MFNTFNSVIEKRTGLRPCLYNVIYKILMSDPSMARSKSVNYDFVSMSHFSTSGLISLIFSPRSCWPGPVPFSHHSLPNTLPVRFVPVRAASGALVAHRYTYAPPRCRISQYRRNLMPLSVSVSNDLAGLVFDGVGMRVLRRGPMLFNWPKLLVYFFLFFLSIG